MQTTSVLIQSLCVPCCNRCRYCLLSWDGRVEGADWERSVKLASRFLRELREQLPQIHSSFAFGYSMEHPNLREAIRTLRGLGSPTASFLQCDGMRMRTEGECRELMEMLLAEGVRQLNFTVYGREDHHDRFAGRRGDFALLGRMMGAAREAGLPFSIGIPLTGENCSQADQLVQEMKSTGAGEVRLFIPHGEGRGETMEPLRLCRRELEQLAPETRSLLNGEIYRTEADWLKEAEPLRETRRQILISLRQDNIEDYEKKSALDLLREIEALDERYYGAFPDFRELAAEYGDGAGDRLYRIRDLYHRYRRLYARDRNLQLYDVTDERQSGSRRF